MRDLEIAPMNNLMTVQQVAEFLGISPKTVYVWSCQGFIPHIKLGRCLRFDPEAIKEWVEQRTRQGRIRKKIEIITRMG